MNDLEAFKQEFDPYIQKHLEQKIKNISKYTKDSSILSYIHYIEIIVMSAGKRIRPYIAFLMYKALGGKEIEKTLKFLVSLELFHSFCLVHDDIMDKADLRHGVQTVHKYIKDKLKKERKLNGLNHTGNSQAVLIGDLLFSWSQEIINLNTEFYLGTMQKVKKLFYEMMDEVSIGQMIDVDASTRKKVSKELIDEKTRLKTAGYSFIKPLQIGATLSGKDNIGIQKFCKEFGLRMGMAFQTQDDLLDITSTDEELKKTTSSDQSQHQHTYFTYFKSLDEGKKIIEENFNEAKTLVKNSKIKEDAKKKFIELIELIENRTF